MERPAATLTMDEMTVVVLPVRPQSRDPACFAVLPPERRIDPVVGIEWRDDDIGDASLTSGVIRLARKFDAKLPELRRQRCVQDAFRTCVLHVGLALLSLMARGR
jgi:hypothetical protein